VGSFVFSLDTVFSPAESPLSPPFHPHSWLSDFVRSVQVGAKNTEQVATATTAIPTCPRWLNCPQAARSLPRLFLSLQLLTRLLHLSSLQFQCKRKLRNPPRRPHLS